MTPLDSFLLEPDLWVTTDHFARLYGRSPRWIKWWCKSGTLAAFNIPTIFLYIPGRFNGPQPGRWYIKLPPTL